MYVCMYIYIYIKISASLGNVTRKTYTPHWRLKHTDINIRTLRVDKYGAEFCEAQEARRNTGDMLHMNEANNTLDIRTWCTHQEGHTNM